MSPLVDESPDDLAGGAVQPHLPHEGRHHGGQGE
jgi:hypothetical protein